LISSPPVSNREDQYVTPSYFGGGARVAHTIAR
jgi:hypothetical protein